MPKISVTVVCAKNLDLVSELAYQEPYCEVKLDRVKSTIQSPPEKNLISKNANPLFNQTLSLSFENVETARLEIEIHDVDQNQKDFIIGILKLRLQNLPKGIPSLAWYKLANPNSMNSKSELQLSLTALDFDTTAPISAIPSSSAMRVSGNLQGSSSSAPPIPSSSSSSSSPVAVPQQARPSQPNKPAPLINFSPNDIKRDHPHIAKGSFGVVYKGYVSGVTKQVVIKDMDLQNAKALADWKKEIEMMGRTRCYYVVEIIGYSSTDRLLTIVMEYMPKGSLYDVLHTRHESLSILQRMRMARHCALGLAHLHRMGVIHRDVKSMNILVTEDYSCKLTDFGCAKVIGDRSQIFNTANSGTPLWMAPEVKMGQYDSSADIYSLGLVLFELFENKLPHFDQIRQTVVLPSHYEAKDVIGPCIDLYPQRRPNADRVVQMLDNLITNILTTVRKELSEAELTNLGISISKASDEEQDKLDQEIKSLYTLLLQKDPKEVDRIIYKAFKMNPSQVQHQQQPQAMGAPNIAPQMGFPPQGGFPQMGYPPQQYPPGFPPVGGMQMGVPPFGQPGPMYPPGMAPGVPYSAYRAPVAQSAYYHPQQPTHQHHHKQIAPSAPVNSSPIFKIPTKAPTQPPVNPYKQLQESKPSSVGAAPATQVPQQVAPKSVNPYQQQQQQQSQQQQPNPQTSKVASNPYQAQVQAQAQAGTLLDDPYGKSLPQVESQSSTDSPLMFEVMKPEKSGNTLLEDLAFPTSPQPQQRVNDVPSNQLPIPSTVEPATNPQKSAPSLIDDMDMLVPPASAPPQSISPLIPDIMHPQVKSSNGPSPGSQPMVPLTPTLVHPVVSAVPPSLDSRQLYPSLPGMSSPAPRQTELEAHLNSLSEEQLRRILISHKISDGYLPDKAALVRKLVQLNIGSPSTSPVSSSQSFPGYGSPSPTLSNPTTQQKKPMGSSAVIGNANEAPADIQARAREDFSAMANAAGEMEFSTATEIVLPTFFLKITEEKLREKSQKQKRLYHIGDMINKEMFITLLNNIWAETN